MSATLHTVAAQGKRGKRLYANNASVTHRVPFFHGNCLTTIKWQLAGLDGVLLQHQPLPQKLEGSTNPPSQHLWQANRGHARTLTTGAHTHKTRNGQGESVRLGRHFGEPRLSHEKKKRNMSTVGVQGVRVSHAAGYGHPPPHRDTEGAAPQSEEGCQTSSVTRECTTPPRVNGDAPIAHNARSV